jgi:hypothetical protein
MKIEMTIKQFMAISDLKNFAEWYISEHEGDGYNYEQWLEDKQVVEAGVKALAEVDQQIQFS